MIHPHSLEPATRVSPELRSTPYSDHMLFELLVMNEEMIGQLRLERQGVVGTAKFLTSMIEQHEKAAAMLRAQLENHEAASSRISSGNLETT